VRYSSDGGIEYFGNTTQRSPERKAKEAARYSLQKARYWSRNAR
jgi:hypothetical protein